MTEGAVTTSWEVTGNHYLSFPFIARTDASIYSVNVLHRGLGGSVEWSGEPLLGVGLRVDGVERAIQGLTWEHLDRWIPQFRCTPAEDLTLRGTICAPSGYEAPVRCALITLELENGGREERTVELALEGTWERSRLWIASARRLSGEGRLVRSAGEPGLALEVGRGPTGTALAIMVAGRTATLTAAAGDGALQEFPGGGELTGPEGEALRFRLARRAVLRPRRRARVTFYLGVGPERDGALGAARQAQRLGTAEVLRGARLELSRLLHTAGDPVWTELLNRNLLFNYFFSLGRAVDDDRLYPVVSRSPLHRPGPVFNEQAALLWSLPALTLSDRWLAREALLRCFEQYSDRPGQRYRYLDGGVLEPGFALHQACAYAVAVDRYVAETGDRTLLDEVLVQDVLRELDEGLFNLLHPEAFLVRTELLPSGDPADYPYVTYDNALVWRFADALERIWQARPGETPPRFRGAAPEIAAALWHHGVAEVKGVPVLSCATNAEGLTTVYDDPTGSLQLLPFLGICGADDPIWRNTVDFLASEAYPLWLATGTVPGLAARNTPTQASLAGLCAALVGNDPQGALARLRRLSLAGGLACDTYDPQTGRGADGLHAAALAGFLAWALDSAVRGNQPVDRGQGSKR